MSVKVSQTKGRATCQSVSHAAFNPSSPRIVECDSITVLTAIEKRHLCQSLHHSVSKMFWSTKLLHRPQTDYLRTYSGDDGLAAVLGHEIAHNVAHHAAERMSQAVVLLPLGIIAFVAAGIDPSIFRMGTSLAFTLPGSRRQEEEADYIGLLMMAESCYNPLAAINLWARMEQEEKGAPPQFLSTHPSSHNRLDKIREWLPEAQDKRENSDCHGIAGFADDFRRRIDFPRW